MVEAVTRQEGLRVVGMCVVNMSPLDPGLLARMVKKLEEVEMSCSQFTGQQLESVMTALCESDSRSKKLNMSDINLSSVDLGLLARAVNRMEEVEMDRNKRQQSSR
jgi:hypothetical protein